MKDNSGKVLLALLAGASAGVIAGLLMAPDTGEATRVSIKKWAGKVSKDLEKNLQASLDEIKAKSNDAMSKMKGAGNEDTSNQGTQASGSTTTTGGAASTGNTTGTGTTSTGTTGGASTTGTGATASRT